MAMGKVFLVDMRNRTARGIWRSREGKSRLNKHSRLNMSGRLLGLAVRKAGGCSGGSERGRQNQERKFGEEVCGKERGC